jgi:hypothetical protein
LLEPWREQHPNGHEQTSLSFAEQEKPFRMLPFSRTSSLSRSNIAIVFHTASESQPVIMHNADAYLTYPVKFDVLFNVIRESVARRRQETVV